MRHSNYDKFPFVAVPNSDAACVVGWEPIGRRLREAVRQRGRTKTVITVECYPGVFEADILQALSRELKPALAIRATDALKSEAEINRLCAPFLGGDDPVFGYLSNLTLPQFFDAGQVAVLKQQVQAIKAGLVLVVGVGARLIAEGDVLVYADLARWEIQQRQRRKEIGNLGVSNAAQSPGLKYKRAFFIDWRVADRWKKPLLRQFDFLLDTNNPREPKLAEGEAVRRGLAEAVRRPFRVVPLFDPGPWGGQWMKEVCDLDRSAVNYAWCFDCVPEENSLRLGFGSHRVEIPAINLVFDQPRALLGDPVHARFGDEFPIRFDFLDTMGGGNLSFQVHPLTEYIQQKFGMHYTQDESYYLLDAAPDACVYLGLKEGVDREALVCDLQAAQTGDAPFPDERYVNRWPAKKHDHFLIPAGTCHCSGKNSMVLEISATPYIFTFKMWDWGRLGLDGKPRPIHLEHGLANLQWDRTTDWVREQLINRITPLGRGEGWREERTGLHGREFIETRRHWFTGRVPHHTGGLERGSVNVLNLVEGDEAVVESPDGAFTPFVVHYAETFIVPAAVGAYTVRPADSTEREHASVKASVRVGPL
ncbi:MAG: class I mannose-6-phosphate isomerase [Verrucomicrobia bacterium]|nr:class I mannose-6-phosphate isomerase [Verrucomicrobiota bacterium]